MKAITTTYRPATSTRAAHVVAKDSDNNKVTVRNLLVTHDSHRDAAVALCRKMNWTGKLVAGSISPVSEVWVFLPHDVILAHRGRVSSEVIDLDMTNEEISTFDRPGVRS